VGLAVAVETRVPIERLELAFARDEGGLGRSPRKKGLENQDYSGRRHRDERDCHNSGLSVLDKSMSAIAADEQIAWERRQRVGKRWKVDRWKMEE
jgi:hypothetical protein